MMIWGGTAEFFQACIPDNPKYGLSSIVTQDILGSKCSESLHMFQMLALA